MITGLKTVFKNLEALGYIDAPEPSDPALKKLRCGQSITVKRRFTCSIGTGVLQGRVTSMRRRTLIPGAAPLEAIVARCEYFGWRCAYCGIDHQVEKIIYAGTNMMGHRLYVNLFAPDLQLDHMIPVSRGGANWPSNLVPCCAHCNYLKGNRTYFEFLRDLCA